MKSFGHKLANDSQSTKLTSACCKYILNLKGLCCDEIRVYNNYGVFNILVKL